MKYYAVIDTNVLVSAMLRRSSVPGNIIALVYSGIIVPLLNTRIVQEYRDVLMRPKFHFTAEIVNDTLDNFEKMGLYVDSRTVEEHFPDPKDRMFYEVTMEKRRTDNAYLVTGNIRHFPEKPFVVTPRQMIDIIAGDIDRE